MIKTVLIEDELNSRNALKQILESYVEEIQIVGEAASVNEGVTLLQKISADLVFMDIHLPDGESFDILDQLGQDDYDFDIIFITAYDDVKERALDYFFLQYLYKPYDIDKIEKAIQHYRKHVNKDLEKYKSILQEFMKNETKLIPVPGSKGIDFISLENIIRLEADRNYTIIYCVEDKSYLSSKNIKHYENVLNKQRFFRVHKSHIINLKHLKFVSNDGLIEMSDNGTVPLATRVKKEFIDFFK